MMDFLPDHIFRSATGVVVERNSTSPGVHQPDAASFQSKLRSVIYIAGANRSGTTLLDILLSQHPAVVSGGELARVPRNLDERSMPCTCGETVDSCPLWRDISEEIGSLARDHGLSVRDLRKFTRALEKRSALARYRKGREPDRRILELYATLQSRIIRRLLRTRPEAAFVVDSSKSQGGAAARPLVLCRYLGLDLRIIHLVRNPEAVLSSALKGRNRDLERGIESAGILRGPRALLAWSRANRSVDELVHEIGEDKVMRLPFEDLVRRPEVVLPELGDFLGLDLQCVLDAIADDEIRPPQHMIGGNRVRFGPIRLDARHAQGDIPWYYRGLCAVAARVVLRR